MSSLFDVLATLPHVMTHLHASAVPLTVGFTVALVAWLVAVEESELKRSRRSADQLSG